MPARRTRLFHWTCEHSATDIRVEKQVVPNLGISWWTDLSEPGKRTRRALGLTSHTLGCDRMEFRCEAAGLEAMYQWRDYLHWAKPSDAWIAGLTASPWVQPDHWWVATVPVPISRVRRFKA